MSSVALDHVSHWYGNVVAVNDITMTIDPGVTGLLGPNGAGKSTLLHLMSGFLAPSAGTVTVGGEPAWRNPRIYTQIGLVTEREAVYSFLTGRDFVVASARLHKLAAPEAAAEAAIAMVDMAGPADRRIDTYSKGMRQRIRVAAALVHDPAGAAAGRAVQRHGPTSAPAHDGAAADHGGTGRTILFSSHILEEVERLADHVQVVVAGRLAASGDYREIRRLMTDRPHMFTVRSTDDRRLAVALIADPATAGVTLDADGLRVEAADFGAFTRLLAGLAKAHGIGLREVIPADESLESVFSYLVAS